MKRRRFALAAVLAASVVIRGSTTRAASGPDGPRIWVSAEDAGEVVAIDARSGQVIQRIKVGRRPRGLKLAPDGKLLYVTLTGSPKAAEVPAANPHAIAPAPAAPDRAADGLAIVDVGARSLLRTLPAGQAPTALDLSPDGKLAFVANGETAEVTVVDLTTGQIKKKISVGQEPSGVAVRPDGKIVYVAATESNEVVAIDTAKLAMVMRVDAGSHPRSVVFAGDGAKAYAIDEQIPQITFLDGRKHTMDGNLLLVNQVKTLFEPRPYAGVLSPNGKVLFVSGGLGQSILVVDLPRRKVVRAIDKVGQFPRGIGISRDGKKLFTANGPSNDVAIIDVASGKVETRVPVPGAPFGLVVWPAAR